MAEEQSLGNLIVSIGGDIAGLKKAVDQGESELRSFAKTVDVQMKSIEQVIDKSMKRASSDVTTAVKSMDSNVVKELRQMRSSSTAQMRRLRREIISELRTVNTSGTQEIKKFRRNVETELKKSSTAWNGFIKTVRAAVLGYATVIATTKTIEFAKGIVTATTEYDALNRSFEVITGSASSAAAELQFVKQTADEYGLSLTALEQAYKGISAASQETSLEGEGVRKIFKSVSAASAVLGLNAQDVEGALRAISQMISKGNIQAEELRGQLGERLPGAFQIMAKALDVSTAELNKMLEQGQVLAEDAIPKLANELERMYGVAAGQAADRANFAFADFKNSVTELQRALGGAGITDAIIVITKALTKMNRAITDSVSGIAELRKQSKDIKKELQSGVNVYDIINAEFDPAQLKDTEEYISKLEALRNTLNTMGYFEQKEMFGNADLSSYKALRTMEQDVIDRIADVKESIVEFQQAKAELEAAAKTSAAFTAKGGADNTEESLKELKKVRKQWEKAYREMDQISQDVFDKMKDYYKQDYDENVRILGDKEAALRVYANKIFELTEKMYGEGGELFGGSDMFDQNTLEERTKAWQSAFRKMGTITESVYEEMMKIYERDYQANLTALGNKEAALLIHASKIAELNEKMYGEGGELYGGLPDFQEGLTERQQAYIEMYQNFQYTSQEAYEALLQQYALDRDAFIQLTGDKEAAYEAYHMRIRALQEDITELWGSELEASSEELEEFKRKGKTTAEEMESAFTGWANGLSSDLNEILWSADTSFSAIAESFAKMVTQMAIQIAIVKPLLESMLNLMNNIGFGSIGSSASSAVTPNAKGNVYESKGLSALSGKVVDTPTLFPFAKGGVGMAGEAGPEGILPLKRTNEGRLGVEYTVAESNKAMDKQASTTFSPNIKIVEAPGTKAEVEESDEGGEFSMSVIISQVENGIQKRMTRGTGMANFLDARYGRRGL